MVRAENWNRLPMIRMTNVSVLPGDKPLTLEDLISFDRPRHSHADQQVVVDRR